MLLCLALPLSTRSKPSPALPVHIQPGKGCALRPSCCSDTRDAPAGCFCWHPNKPPSCGNVCSDLLASSILLPAPAILKGGTSKCSGQRRSSSTLGLQQFFALWATLREHFEGKFALTKPPKSRRLEQNLRHLHEVWLQSSSGEPDTPTALSHTLCATSHEQLQTVEPTAATHSYLRAQLAPDLLLQAIWQPPLSHPMSCPDQEQDTGMVHDISDLPEELRMQTAAWVEHGTLPALRLVSRGWNKAANLAVRRLGHGLLQPEQMMLLGQRWPNLERLYLDCYGWPDKYCRDLISFLMPLTRIQGLSLGIGAALLPEGQDFILRQTRLLSLRTIGCFDSTPRSLRWAAATYQQAEPPDKAGMWPASRAL